MIYFISTDKLKVITGTSNAMSDEKIRSSIYLCQINDIIPILGQETYQYIGSLITAGLIADGSYEKELIDSYLQPIIAWRSLSLAVTPANSQTNIGTSHQSDIVADANPYISRNHYASIANAYTLRANRWLEKVKFPHYVGKCDGKHSGDYFGIQI